MADDDLNRKLPRIKILSYGGSTHTTPDVDEKEQQGPPLTEEERKEGERKKKIDDFEKGMLYEDPSKAYEQLSLYRKLHEEELKGEVLELDISGASVNQAIALTMLEPVFGFRMMNNDIDVQVLGKYIIKERLWYEFLHKMIDVDCFYPKQLVEEGDYSERLKDLQFKKGERKPYGLNAIRDLIHVLEDKGYLEQLKDTDKRVKKLRSNKGYYTVVCYEITNYGKMATELTNKIGLHNPYKVSIPDKSESHS